MCPFYCDNVVLHLYYLLWIVVKMGYLLYDIPHDTPVWQLHFDT